MDHELLQLKTITDEDGYSDLEGVNAILNDVFEPIILKNQTEAE